MNTTATRTSRTFTRAQVALKGSDPQFNDKNATVRIQGRNYSGTLVRLVSNDDLALMLDVDTYYGAGFIEVWSHAFNNLTPHDLESLTIKNW